MIADLTAGPFFGAALLLVAGGAAKLGRPAPAARALTAARIPGGTTSARAIGVVEVAAGTAAMLAPTVGTAALVALLYVAFAVFVAAVASGRVVAPSCGCLGERDTPASRLHVVLDLLAAAVALIAVVWQPRSLPAMVSSSPLSGVLLLVGVSLLAYLAYLAAAYVPELFFSYRRSTVTAAPEGARG